jgi:hypothetical protein
MTRSRYGLLAGLAGAAFAWWWRHRGTHRQSASRDTYGETIYRNTPEPSGLGGGPT